MRIRKTFTLTGVLIAVVILAILVTIGFPLYLNAVENARAKVCATNLEVLKAAVETYGVQEGALPGSLSMLRPVDIKKAWAKVFQKENPWLIKLAYFLVDFDKRGLAYARNVSFRRFVAADSRVFECPDDKNGPPSYGINSAIANLSWRDYERLSSSIWIIADCDHEVCKTPVRRHFSHTRYGKKWFYQFVKKNGKLGRGGNGGGKGHGKKGHGKGKKHGKE